MRSAAGLARGGEVLPARALERASRSSKSTRCCASSRRRRCRCRRCAPSPTARRCARSTASATRCGSAAAAARPTSCPSRWPSAWACWSAGCTRCARDGRSCTARGSTPSATCTVSSPGSSAPRAAAALADRYVAAARGIAAAFDALVAGVAYQRIHADLHLGNVLLRDGVLRLLDFDDMAMGPPVQDVWLAVPGRDADSLRRRDAFLDGYERFRSFDHATLRLVEPLRGLRLVRYAGWLARRWNDPAFRAGWPHFGTAEYWRDETETLEAQLRTIHGERPEVAARPRPRAAAPPREELLSNRDYFFDWEELEGPDVRSRPMAMHLDSCSNLHQDALMRTTITLEDDVARLVDEEIHRTRSSLKEVVNDALRRASARHPLPSRKSPTACGLTRRHSCPVGIAPD